MPEVYERLYAEMLINGTWVDYTSDVRTEDEIRITRSRTDERPSLNPDSADLVINDLAIKADRSGPSVTGVFGGWRDSNPLSPFYRQLGRYTQTRISIRPDPISDTFTRTSSSSWGTTTPGGRAYTSYFTSGGSGADFNVAGGQGTHAVGTAAHVRLSALESVVTAHVDQAVTVTCPLATGGDLLATLVYRATSGNTYGHIRLCLTTSGAVVLRAYTAADILTEIGSATVPSLTHTGTGQPIRFRVQAIGRTIRARAWAAAAAEPSVWHLTATDTATIQTGWIGVRSARAPANTNTGTQFSYDDYTAQPIDMRAWLEIPEWKPDLDQTGTFATMALGCAGSLSRLAESDLELRSPVYNYISGSTSSTDLLQYWPLEDPSGATSGESILPGYDMSIIGSPQFAGYSGFPGSDPVVVLPDGAGLIGSWPATGSYTAIQMSIQIRLPATQLNNQAVILSLSQTQVSTRFELRWLTGGQLRLVALNAYGQIADSGTITLNLSTTNTSYWIAVSLTQNGTAIDWNVKTRRIELTPMGSFAQSGSFAGMTFSSFGGARIFPNRDGKGAAVGHAAIGKSATFIDANIARALTGFNAEPAGDRFIRLAAEVGVDAQVYGDATTAMAVQTSGQLLDQLSLCAATVSGIICDSRHFLGLELRPARSTYLQTDPLILDYAAGHLAPPLRPITDPALAANLVTVENVDKVTAVAELTTGRMSTQNPPAGLGQKEVSIKASATLYDTLTDLANWRLTAGTQEGDRWPGITIRLENAALSALTSVQRLDIGSVLLLRNLPRHYATDDVPLLLYGYTETIGSHTRTLRANTAPAEHIYGVGAYDATTARADSRSSTLTAQITSTATSFSVTTTDSLELWITGSGLGLRLDIGGEIVTVDTISGTASPQTFSGVTRSVNGIVKVQPAGTSVRLADPSRYAL